MGLGTKILRRIPGVRKLYALYNQVQHLELRIIERIPLLKAATEKFVHEPYQIEYNGESCSFERLRQMGFNVQLPPGWLDYDKSSLENKQ